MRSWPPLLVAAAVVLTGSAGWPLPPGMPVSVDPPPVLVPIAGPALPAPEIPAGTPARTASPAQETPAASPAAPAPLGAPMPPAPVSAPAPIPGDPLDPELVSRALRPLLRGGALGSGRSPARVVDVATGAVLYAAADGPTVPASTMKLVTALGALRTLGADAVLRTRAVMVDPARPRPRVVLVGAGDPSLSSSGTPDGSAGARLAPASLQQLADRTSRALRDREIGEVRVGFDDSLFEGAALHPSWAAGFPAMDVVAPVSALQVDQGRPTPGGARRVAEPAQQAAATFAELLADAGVRVRGKPARVATGAGVALAHVDSPSVGMLVERMLASSDNDYAEALGRLAALAAGHPGSFDGVATTAREVLEELGLDTAGARFADASGLSRGNRLAPGQLTDLLRLAAGRYGHLAAGMPVAGATGSLRDRFSMGATRPARGVVRAKTGTLTGVVGLAGYASRPDGRLLAFAFVDDSTAGSARASRSAVDRAAAELVACDCRVGVAGQGDG